MTISHYAELLLDDIVSRKPRTSWLLNDLYAERTACHSWLLEDSKITESVSSFSSGVASRAVSPSGTLLSFRSEATFSNALACMDDIFGDTSAKAARAESGDREALFCGDARSQVLLPGIIRELDSMIRSSSSTVRQVTLRFDTGVKEKLIFPGENCVRNETAIRTSLSLHITVSDCDGMQTASDLIAGVAGCESFLRDNDLFERAKSLVERAVNFLSAPKCPAGRFPVLLSGKTGGTMIHEACGHGLEADIVMKDFSVFRDRLGDTVASPFVTIVDDPTSPCAYGGYGCDDEGTPSRRTVLVDRGVLNGYLTDRETSAKMSLPLTGNGRRASFRHVPIPRMSATSLLPGPEREESILDGMGNGLYVTRLGGGEVDPTTGDFVFQVTEGFQVQAGKVRNPVRGALLVGNGPDVLKSIAAVGDRMELFPGYCGKNGQDVPISDGQPALLIPDIVVGGE
jgi:TldD protein